MAVVARFESYLQALDAAKPRAWPLGVATLAAGQRHLRLRACALSAGAPRASAALVQLVVAQAGATRPATGSCATCSRRSSACQRPRTRRRRTTTCPSATRPRCCVRAAKMRRAGYPIALRARHAGQRAHHRGAHAAPVARILRRGRHQGARARRADSVAMGRIQPLPDRPGQPDRRRRGGRAARRAS